MYEIDNCVLIRKTAVFPKNGVIQTPIHRMTYDFSKSTLLGDAINKKLREKYKSTDKVIQESKKYDIYYETYRRTIHFSINGVVPNTFYGHFNYPYAIIEPLKYHIDDESLLGLRVEDTYFVDDMHLSDEAVILIPKEDKEELSKKYDFENLKIQTYTGDIEKAIKDILEQAGYDFFVVKNNGYQDGLNPKTKASKMYNFIYEYSQKHEISQSIHFLSDINYEDQLKGQEEGEKIDELHLKYVLDSGLVSQETIDKINSIFTDRKYFQKEFEKLMCKVVDEVGLDNLAQLTKEFNQKMINERKLRKATCKTPEEAIKKR